MKTHDCGCNKGAVVLAARTLAERKFGWDGESALPLREDVAATIGYVYSLSFPICFSGIGYPTMDLCYDGTVEIVYTHGDRELVLQFQCRYVVEYVSRNKATGFESSGVFRLNERLGVLAMQEAVAWLKGE